MKDSNGYFEKKENVVALNPEISDEALALTFVHELRHVWQEKQKCATSYNLTPKAYFLTGFADEADACAAEVTYAHEMRKKNPKIWESHQKSCYAPMSAAFEKSMNESGDVNKARGESFKAWYGLRIKDRYSRQYVEYLSKICTVLNAHSDTDESCLSQDCSGDEIVNKILKDSDGKTYMPDAKFLESPAHLSITEKQATFLSDTLIKYMDKYHRSESRLGLDKVMTKSPSGVEKSFGAVIRDIRKKDSNTAVFGQRGAMPMYRLSMNKKRSER